jgi:acetylornithine deacetylase
MKRQTKQAIQLLRTLISIESYSKTENKSADEIASYLNDKGVITNRVLNNIWAVNKYYDANKPTILLNSHHDTVRPNAKYTRDPFCPLIEDGKLYGLGSNDAGGSLVSLMACFIYFYTRKNLTFNLLFAATAEEEISGENGIEKILPLLGNISFGLVGEPTKMNMAIAEKGLVVLDCIAHGVAGHAAREEGDNAIYKAIKDIEWFRTFKFPETSKMLGEVKMTVSVLKSGFQHNVVPDSCLFTVDVRTTDVYSNAETVELIKKNVSCEVVPRSIRLNSSSIHIEHPIVQAGVSMGLFPFGSPTLSDQSLMNFPSLKMGPGDSARSHTADEFIFIQEIEEAVEVYIQLFESLTFDKSFLFN